ncbi:hypothetical protein ACTMTF_18000 [Nonomuraea sp. ZG12]|uniref:hypothetical protein n=1 Tax=Nonomuraea sp. ZG12 TaxID=3452207 RepID=UPI003F8C28D0
MIGISAGHRTEREAEHWLRESVLPLGLPGLFACTHLVRIPYPHVAVSLAAEGSVRQGDEGEVVGLPVTPPELAEAAAHAAAEHAARRSGRAVLYPGVERLVGTLTVGEVTALSAIERVTRLGGPPPEAETVLETRDFVRPHWQDGVLTLVTMPVAGGRVAPFEVPDPTPCCADHT